jgi:hypothetical protein
MASAAVAGIGTQLKIGDGGGSEVFTTIGEVKDITGPAVTVDIVEVTNMDSPSFFKEYIPTLKDGGEVTFDVNYIGTSTTQAQLVTDYGNRTRRNFQLVTTHASPKTIAFAAYITNLSHSFPIADAVKRSVTLRITSAVTGL